MSQPAVDLNAHVEDRPDASAEGPEGVRSLHEKLETAFTPSGAGDTPRIFQSGFDSAIRQQSAAFQELNSRIERLESDGMVDLRSAMREICEAVAGLALEVERGTSATDEKLQTLAETLQSQIDADREHMDAMELQAREAIAGNAQALDEIRQTARRMEERIALLDTRGLELSRNLAVLKDEISAATATALRGHRARLEQAEGAISEIQTRASQTAERLVSLDANDETLLHRIGGVKEEIAVLKDYDMQAAEQAEAVQSYAESLARELDAAKAELVELHETAAVVQAHQKVLEQAEEDIAELKERQTRAVIRVESLGGRHEELAGELRLVKADLQESSSVLRAHQKNQQEQTERSVAELKDRQTQSAARIDLLAGSQDEQASHLRLTKADLKNTADAVQTHQGLLEQAEKSFTDLKDRNLRAAMRIDALDGRHNDLANEVRAAKADLEKNIVTVQAHQMRLNETDKAVGELKDRQTRAAMRMDSMDGRQEELAGNLRITHADVGANAIAISAHQAALAEADKSITDLKDRQLRAGQRMDAMDVRQNGLAIDLNAAKVTLADKSVILDAHHTQLADAEKAIAEGKDRQTRAVLRMDSMDSRHEELAGNLRLTRADLGATAAAVGVHQGALAEAGKSITDLKDRQLRTVQRMDATDIRQNDLSGDLNATKSTLEEKSVILDAQQTALADAEKAIAEGKDRQARAALRLEAMGARQLEMASDLRQIRTDLNKAGETVTAHQAALTDADKAIIELKDRGLRAACGIEALEGCQDEQAANLRAVKSVLEEKSAVIDAHGASLGQAEKIIAELKDRQTRAVMRMDSMDSRQQELASELRLTRTDLTETAAIVNTHQTQMAQAESAIAELKDGGARAASRIDAQGGRQEELWGDMSVVKAGLAALSDTPNVLRTHKALIDNADNAIAELKDRGARAVVRIEALDGRQEEFSGEMQAVKAGLSALNDTPNQLRAHQSSLDQNDKAIADLKERQTRASSRIELLVGSLGDVSGKVEAQSVEARGIEERLRETERSILRSVERERALAQLHARAVDDLREPGEG